MVIRISSLWGGGGGRSCFPHQLMKFIQKIYDSVTNEIWSLIYLPMAPLQCCYLVKSFPNHRDQEPPQNILLWSMWLASKFLRLSLWECSVRLLLDTFTNCSETGRKQICISFIKQIFTEPQFFGLFILRKMCFQPLNGHAKSIR